MNDYRVRTTTDLPAIRKNPALYTWGTVIQIHDIGTYSFVEYTDDQGRMTFGIYVDGKDITVGACTLDEAILIAISFKRLAHSEDRRSMALSAAKLLNVPISE